jgi:hypothetical protein
MARLLANHLHLLWHEETCSVARSIGRSIRGEDQMEEIQMKIAILLATALVVFTSIPIKAQQASAAAQQSTAVSGAGGQLNASGSASAERGTAQLSGSASASEEMRPVNAELVGKLDSKSAKVGDQVVMKTTEAMKAADGTVIPKGTRLVGHVTSVAAHTKSSADSAMAIQFDRAELKGGTNMAIHSEIRSVAPPASAAMSSAMQSDDTLSGPMGGGMGGGARAMGGGAMGGGVGRVGGGGLVGGGAVGGVAGSAVGGVAGATGRAGAGLGAATDNSAGAVGHAAGETAASVDGRGGLATSAAGDVTAHSTGVRGVMLAGDATGKASGTLSATNQNVHLDGGTQMVLGVATVK